MHASRWLAVIGVFLVACSRTELAGGGENGSPPEHSMGNGLGAESVAILRLTAPSTSPFVLRATIPVPPGFHDVDSGTSPFMVLVSPYLKSDLPIAEYS